MKRRAQVPKKGLQLHTRNDDLNPRQIFEFMHNYQQLVLGKDSPTVLISLRVPENVLSTFKVMAKQRGQKYQPLIVQLMREWIKNSPKT